MDKRAEEIARDIESGEYFSEAKKWYNTMFVYPLKWSVIMRIIGIAMISITIIMAFNLYKLFPLVTKVQIVTDIKDTINFFPKLVVATDSNKTDRQFVIEALGAKYVISREGYEAETFKTNYLFLLKSSSKEIFDQYYKSITSKGDSSPLNLYVDKSVAKIKILSKESAVNANKVTIIFDKDIFSGYGEFQSSSRWKAEVEFYLSNYDFNESTNAKLDFIVTKYTVSEIKKS
jgi:type IV secretion system protein VirB8